MVNLVQDKVSISVALVANPAFLSTHSTMLCSGGFRYKPTTSVSFSGNVAFRDSLNVFIRCGLRL